MFEFPIAWLLIPSSAHSTIDWKFSVPVPNDWNVIAKDYVPGYDY